MRFVLLPGQRHDTVGVPPLIEGAAFGALLGDKAFYADWLRADLEARGAAAVIPPKANRKARISFDRDIYRWQTLGLRVEGERFEVSLDGRTLFSAADRTFAEAGRVGLWTKADSLTHFDAFEAEELR